MPKIKVSDTTLDKKCQLFPFFLGSIHPLQVGIEGGRRRRRGMEMGQLT
jgi:hypothetical protein